MVGEIIVNTEVMVAQADTVAGLISQVSTQFENIKNLVNRTQSYWIGEAGNLHREKYISSQPEIEKAIKRLNEHVVDLKAMAGVFDTKEREALNEAEKLTSHVID